MEWLNYHHLHYFWAVVQEGGIAAASRRLQISRPSISMQLKSLEAFFGQALFERRGRHLELTETGRLVHGYADEIFTTGRELVDAVRGRPTGRPVVFRVGIADVMTKLVAFQLLLPVLEEEGGEDGSDLMLQCSEDHPERLFARLALHELDLVLSDVPVTPRIDVRAYNHVMGESGITLFAAPKLARRLKRGFPDSLQGAPFLMPGPGTAVRSGLRRWLEDRELRPRVVGEFEDSALLKVFGHAAKGVFPAPTVVADEVCKQYEVRALGEVEVSESFYAVTPERRIKHPAVSKLVESARRDVFG